MYGYRYTMSSPDSDEKMYDSDGNAVDSDGNIVDSDGNIVESDDNSADLRRRTKESESELDNVIKALKDIVPDEADVNKDFFCVEDSFLSKDVKVSVNDVGPLNFPLQEKVVKNLIKKSEKAKFGKALKTVLDTNYRDTQKIPADKLKVELNEEILHNLLERIGKEFNVGQHSKLEIHLYNMLIYGPGQFFKRHRDTEKVPNMIATLVLILPSPHKGGDLVIEHNKLTHKFFASPSHEIIKCIAFYPDCFHEVKKVEEGYRVALTYNVELKSTLDPSARSGTVDENLKDAVNKYFEETKSDVLVYFLDHQYTEKSLKWSMLKASDQISANAFLAVGKQENYPTCLALAKYHEVWDEDCKEDYWEKDAELHFFIDENDKRLDCKTVSISEGEFCFLKDKKNFKRDKRDREVTGNEGTTINEWYHRSAVVLWRNAWECLAGCKKEYHTLHQLIAQPGKQKTLLKKIKDNSQNFFSSKFWNDESIKKMVLDIMMYLNDQETSSKILSKLKPSEVLDLAKNEFVTWISTNCSLETWKFVIKAWEKSSNSQALLRHLLPFLSNYMTKANKDVGVAGYLLDEVARFFMDDNSSNSYSFYGGYSRQDNNSEKHKQLCTLLQISFQLGKLDLEKALMKKADSKSSAAQFKMFQKELHPEQFRRISEDLLSKMTDVALGKIELENYIYGVPNLSYIQEICSLLENCGKLGNTTVEEKILNQIMSNPKTNTASFLADLFVKIMKNLKSNANKYTDLKDFALNKIQAELEKLKNPNDCSLPINLSCNCEFCSQAQKGLASSTSMQVLIPATKKNRSHVESNLKKFVNIFPIKLDTITTGSPHKLSITKLPKLLEDRQNMIKRLMEARDAMIAPPVPGKPAAKKKKTQE